MISELHTNDYFIYYYSMLLLVLLCYCHIVYQQQPQGMQKRREYSFFYVPSHSNRWSPMTAVTAVSPATATGAPATHGCFRWMLSSRNMDRRLTPVQKELDIKKKRAVLSWNQEWVWNSCTECWTDLGRNPCLERAATVPLVSWGNDRWKESKCRDSCSCSDWPVASGRWKSQLQWECNSYTDCAFGDSGVKRHTWNYN